MKKLLVSILLMMSLAGQSHAASAIKMTVATGIDPSLAAFYIGKVGGFFEKNGLDVTLNTGASGSAMVPFLVRNQVQAVFGGEQAGIQTNALDPDVVVAAEMLQVQQYMGIVGKGVADVAALKGKRIGVVLGSASEVFWNAFISKLGLNANDYNIVPVEPPEMLAALERGDIDAAAAYEPWLTRILRSVKGAKLIRDNIGIINNRSFVYLNKTWAERNPDAAASFMKALVQATDFIHSNPDQAAQEVSSFLKLDLDLTKLLMAKMDYKVRMMPDSVAYLKSVEAQLAKSGKLKKAVNWDDFVYDKPLMRAQAN
ncbi:MAG: ABC transporter substrate-binding protein [Beijerinckiaceae bacterium]|nr:ABC transporter substrate-binding protein [Beijerinckiaceae bacterium]